MAIYGDSFGGIQSARYNDAAMRQQQSQHALGLLMRALEQRQIMQQRAAEQAQDQAYRQRVLQMNLDQAAEASRQHEAANKYNERAYREIILPESQAKLKQPTKSDVAELNNLEADLKFRIENRLPYDPNDYTRLPEPVRTPLMTYDASARQEETEALERAKAAALAGRRIRMIQQRAGELSTAPKTPTGWYPFSGSTYPAEQPQVVSREMTTRLAPFAQRYAPLLDPKAKLVTIDPATGDYMPNPDLVKPWMAATQGPPQASRQLKMTDTGTTAAAAKPSIFKNEATTIDVLLPDGRVVTGPSTNAAALLKRFPGAQLLINN